MTNLLPPPSPPVPPPLSPSPSASPAGWWKRKLWKLPVWAWVLIAVLAIGGAASAGSKNKTKDAPSPQVTAPLAAAPAGTVEAPADCSGVACQMTKDSGIHGIPLPADAVTDTSSPTDLQITSVGTLEEVTAFYHDYLTAHGWTFDVKNSTLDPAVAETRSLGHISNGVYCQATSPVLTVMVIVGIVDSGPKVEVEIGLVDDEGETSCP